MTELVGAITHGKKVFAYLLIAALILTVGINIYQYTQNLSLSKQKDELNTKLEMSSLLTQVQFQINGELEKLGSLKI